MKFCLFSCEANESLATWIVCVCVCVCLLGEWWYYGAGFPRLARIAKEETREGDEHGGLPLPSSDPLI